jgi:quinol monooxygenase YgiN
MITARENSLTSIVNVSAALDFHQRTNYLKQFIAKSDALLLELIDVFL